jgi:hypothetical protein
MPAEQTLDELGWRTRWHTEQLRADREQAEVEEQERAARVSRDLHYDLDHGMDYGMDLGESDGYELGY